MKILVISNYFPPYYLGGYELRCKDITDYLRKKRHSVVVLTSRFGPRNKIREKDVYRSLWLSPPFTVNRFTMIKFFVKECINNVIFKKTIKSLRPDLIFIWNMQDLGKSLLFTADKTGIPVSYFIEYSWIYKTVDNDTWISYCRYIQKKGFLLKRIFLRFAGIFGPVDFGKLNFKYIIFVSYFLKEQALKSGMPAKDTLVINGGIPLENFSPGSEKECSNGKIKLLYVGQINELKGVYTLIKAYKKLSDRNINHIELSFAGYLDERNKNRFEKEIESIRDSGNVKYLGTITRSKLRDIYTGHDILIFPSNIDEAFPLTLAEAMSCGMNIVSTRNGGACEMLKDRYNCLVFERGNVDDLVEKITLLLNDNSLRKELSINARKYAIDNFDINKMGEKIESILSNIVLETKRKKEVDK